MKKKSVEGEKPAAVTKKSTRRNQILIPVLILIVLGIGIPLGIYLTTGSLGGLPAEEKKYATFEIVNAASGQNVSSDFNASAYILPEITYSINKSDFIPFGNWTKASDMKLELNFNQTHGTSEINVTRYWVNFKAKVDGYGNCSDIWMFVNEIKLHKQYVLKNPANVSFKVSYESNGTEIFSPPVNGSIATNYSINLTVSNNLDSGFLSVVSFDNDSLIMKDLSLDFMFNTTITNESFTIIRVVMYNFIYGLSCQYCNNLSPVLNADNTSISIPFVYLSGYNEFEFAISSNVSISGIELNYGNQTIL